VDSADDVVVGVGHSVVHGEGRGDHAADDNHLLLGDDGVEAVADDDFVGGNDLFSGDGLEAGSGDDGASRDQAIAAGHDQVRRGELDVAARHSDDVGEFGGLGVLSVGNRDDFGELGVAKSIGSQDSVTNSNIGDQLSFTGFHLNSLGSSEADVITAGGGSR